MIRNYRKQTGLAIALIASMTAIGNVVAADEGIDRTMDLDPAHFHTAKQSSHVDVMDLVAADCAENGSETADNSGLLAM